MKKVRKQEVEELILLYYQMFIECAPDYELEETVTVDINSIYITVMDYRDFNDVETKMKAINDFDKKLKKVTFGNLYVAYMEVKNDDTGCRTLMHIANAYEVEEDNEGYHDSGDSWEE